MLLALEPPSGGVNDACRSWWRHDAQSVQAAVVSALITAVMWGPAKYEAIRGTEDHRGRWRSHGHRRPCFRGSGRSLLKSRCTGSSRVWRLSAQMMVVRRPCLCWSWQTGRLMVWTPPPFRFLTASALEARRKEEEEEEQEVEGQGARGASGQVGAEATAHPKGRRSSALCVKREEEEEEETQASSVLFCSRSSRLETWTLFLRAPWCLFVTRWCPACPRSTGKLMVSGRRLPRYFLSFSVCLARGIQENWNSLRYDLFLRTLVSSSHLFGVRLWSPGLWTFPGDDFRKCRIQRFLVRQWTHVTASLRFFFCVLFPYSALCLVLSGPRYAPVTEFTSLISLSLRRGSSLWFFRPW